MWGGQVEAADWQRERETLIVGVGVSKEGNFLESLESIKLGSSRAWA